MTVAREPSHWVRRPDLFWRAMPGGILVLTPEGQEPVLLDGAAPAVWELLARPRTAEELAAIVSATGDDERITSDLSAFLTALVEASIVLRLPWANTAT